MDIFRKIFRQFGLRGFIEFMIHPLLIPLFSIFAWVRTLWASRILLDGQWSRFHGFKPKNSLNCLFYRTQWLNFDRFGSTGRSPLVGLGDFPLSRWFYLTFWSSYIYAFAGAATTLSGTFLWSFSHLVWGLTVPWTWVALVSLALLCSSTGYAMAFVIQNYNILGWIWLPLVLFGALSGNLILVALALLAGSFASVTMVASSFLLLTVFALVVGQIEVLFTLLPAGIKMGTHLIPLIKDGGLKTGLVEIAKLIGLVGKGVRYKRNSMRLSVTIVYFLLLYGLGGIFLWWYNNIFPLMPAAAIALYIVNERFTRFMDRQSCYIIFVSTFAAWIMFLPVAWVNFAALILIANPLPQLIGVCSFKKSKSLTRIPALSPFNHTPIIEALDKFLSPVLPGSRILMAFDDPGNKYESIFDGYRILIEPPLYLATKKGIHLFPDWYAVAETNYFGAPSFWGRDKKVVRENMIRWDAKYVIVYQDSRKNLDPAWHDDFIVLMTFDWADWEFFFRGDFIKKPPKWWLLTSKYGLSV